MRAVKPAVKQVVWDLLHQTATSTPLDDASPSAASQTPQGTRGGGTGAHDASAVDACDHGPDDDNCSCASRSGPGSPTGAVDARAVHLAAPSGVQSPRAVDTQVARLRRQCERHSLALSSAAAAGPGQQLPPAAAASVEPAMGPATEPALRATLLLCSPDLALCAPTHPSPLQLWTSRRCTGGSTYKHRRR